MSAPAHLPPADARIVRLQSSDQKDTYDVSVHAASSSGTIQNVLEEIGSDPDGEIPLIPLPNVDPKTLSWVADFMKNHPLHSTTAPSPDAQNNKPNEKPTDKPNEKQNIKEAITEFNRKFLDEHGDTEHLCALITAANYLNIPSLMDLTAQAIADKIKGKTPQQIREIFKIKNDFTPEEEEEVRKENAWAFE